MVLERLASIDWQSKQHAYGTAQNIPQLLQELVDSKPACKKKALDELTNLIAHQGFAEEIAIDVVPFLFELITEDCSADRAGILILLADLSVGGWHGHLVAGASLDEILRREIVASLRSKVAAGQKIFESLLKDKSSSVRGAAFLCLAIGTWQKGDSTLDVLVHSIGREKNGNTLASMLCSLGLASRCQPCTLPDVVASFDKHRNAQVRAAADLARSLNTGHLLHREDLAGLVEKGKPLRGCAFLDGNLVDLATRVIASDAVDRGDIDTLCSLVKQAKGMTRTRTAVMALECLLPPIQEPRVASELTKEQRSFLSLLDSMCLPVWTQNYPRFGIPARRLERYLGAGEALGPLDDLVKDCPVWKLLWSTFNGHSSVEAWLEALAVYSAKEVIALCRDAFAPESYLVYPWPPFFKRSLEVEARQNDHQFDLWIRTLCCHCSLEDLQEYLGSLGNTFHLEEEALVAATAIVSNGGNICSALDKLVMPAMRINSPTHVGTVLKHLVGPRRLRFYEVIDSRWRESFSSLL